MAVQLCPGLNSNRLDANPSIDCDQQWAFYMPGAVLTLIMFTIGVPYMFYHLTARHTKMYESLDIYAKATKPSRSPHKQTYLEKFMHQKHVESQYTQVELDDLWLRRVRRAKRNRAKNLYADFEYQWRYWKMVVLGQKFLVVLIAILKEKMGSVVVAPILMLIIHSSMFVISMVARPYTDKRPDMLSMSISAANVFNWALLLVMALDVAAPAWMIYIIVVINLVVPICCLVGGHFLNIRKKRIFTDKLANLETTRTYLKPEEIVKGRRTVERHINEFTLRFLSHWTWAVLLCSVIGGELIFIGTFAEAALTPVTGPTAGSDAKTNVVDCYQEEHARNQEFIGFGNWSRFTQSCCCMSRSNATGNDFSTHVMELWTCTNDVFDDWESVRQPIIYKERQRRPLEAESLDSGLPVRGFCDTVFRDRDGNAIADMEPIWNEDVGKLGLMWKFPNGTVDRFWDDFW